MRVPQAEIDRIVAQVTAQAMAEYHARQIGRRMGEEAAWVEHQVRKHERYRETVAAMKSAHDAGHRWSITKGTKVLRER